MQRLLSAYSEAKLLGLFATNIRYLDNQRDMADELFDGNVASEMTLGEAIVRGILNAPTYVLSVFAYQQDYDRLKSRVHRAKSKATRDAAEKYTVSPIIYKQQIGRALSASKAKKPVIFDIVNNIENLYSISTVEQEMQAAINYYARSTRACSTGTWTRAVLRGWRPSAWSGTAFGFCRGSGI